MKEYFVFKIKKDFVKLYRNNSGNLFSVLNRIYYMKMVDIEYGKNLFEQIAEFIDKDSINSFIENYYRDNFIYQRCKKEHVINNIYSDEISVLTAKNTHIKIETNKERPIFIDLLKKYDDYFFVCDFKEQDYFFINKKIKLML